MYIPQYFDSYFWLTLSFFNQDFSQEVLFNHIFIFSCIYNLLYKYYPINEMTSGN